jgi:transposase
MNTCAASNRKTIFASWPFLQLTASAAACSASSRRAWSFVQSRMIDAEAICEAAQRPSMRFVAVKSEQQQAAGLVFRTRDLLVRQRTQLINAIRGHLTEYGWIAPKGPSHVAMLADLLEEEMARSLPEAARAMFRLMLDLLASLDGKIADLDKEIARRAREDEVSRRLMTVPGVGPISATAIAALAPPAETFAKGRDFAAWLGLTPLQKSTGGKQKLGVTSKMGERTLRRLLIIGSSAVVRQASKRGAPKGSWLEQMLARKPRMLVTVALANKMARIIWALLVKQENYELRSQPRREPGRPEVVADVVGRRRVWRNSRRDGVGRTR